MSAYVDIEYVKLVGIMRPEDVEELEQQNPGTVDAVAESVSRIFDGRLAKRYATPFKTPFPEILRAHVAAVVVYQLFLKRGFNPGSAQDEAIKLARDEAFDWLKEAANAKDGLVELPLKEADEDASGVTKGGVIASSEPSPYDWIDAQREALRGRR